MKCLRIINTTLPIITLVASAQVMATPSLDNFYIGGGAGYAHFNGLGNININKLSLPFPLESSVEDASAANTFVGYNINQYLSTEVGYLYSGNAYTNNDEFNSQGITFSAVSHIPVTTNLSLLLEAGLYFGHTHGLETKNNNTSPLLGSGLSYELTKNFSLQARWRYLSNIASLSNEAKYIGVYTPNENITTLEFLYHPSFSHREMPTPAPAPAPQLSSSKNKQECIVNTHVQFDINSSYITDRGRNDLNGIYQQYIDKVPTCSTIYVVGFTDETGSDAYNLSLSKRRADAVSKYLTDMGIVSKHIVNEGRGELHGDTHKKDRRVEVSLK